MWSEKSGGDQRNEKKKKGSKYTKNNLIPHFQLQTGVKKEGGSIFHKSKSGYIDQHSVTLTTYILE